MTLTQNTAVLSEDMSEDVSMPGATRARLLLERWGGAPLLFFALLPDKQYLFSDASGDGWGIACRTVGRHALALGDPLGDPAKAPEAVAAFLAFCRKRGKTPAFYQVTADHLGAYKAAGLKAVKVGEDAQIDLADFALAGKRFKTLRNDLRRVEKAGVTLETYGVGDAPPPHVADEMEDISRGWRRAHRAGEGNFAMGGFDAGSALFRESRCFIARDSETGRMLAFTTFVPAFGPGRVDGWTLDLMRRRADALHGVMDFLIVSAAQAFAAEGAARLSLGLSPLAGADDGSESAALACVRRFLFQRLNRVYNFQGLHTFKGKFATHWEPRYLVYRRDIALAATGGAIVRAHLSAPATLAPRPVRISGPARRAGLVLGALLLLLMTPFEKTLAHRLAQTPRRWHLHRAVRFHAPHLRTARRQGGRSVSYTP